jgi:hypothetical protein
MELAMTTITRTRLGHWADHPLHSDSQEGPIERFLEFDEEARRNGKSNFPMAAVVPCLGAFAILLVSVGALAVYLIRI